MVEVDDGVATGTDWIEPSIFVDICGESRNGCYKDLFIDDDLGAISDIPGMVYTYPDPTALQKLVWKLIDAEKNELLKAVLQYAGDLVEFDEDGSATPESRAEVTNFLEANELTENLPRILGGYSVEKWSEKQLPHNLTHNDSL